MFIVEFVSSVLYFVAGVLIHKYFAEKIGWTVGIVWLLALKKMGYRIEPPVVERVNIRTLQRIEILNSKDPTTSVTINTNFLLKKFLKKRVCIEDTRVRDLIPDVETVKCFYKYVRQGVSININNETSLKEILTYTRR
jgi:hypothetical protein